MCNSAAELMACTARLCLHKLLTALYVDKTTALHRSTQSLSRMPVPTLPLHSTQLDYTTPAASASRLVSAIEKNTGPTCTGSESKCHAVGASSEGFIPAPLQRQSLAPTNATQRPPAQQQAFSSHGMHRPPVSSSLFSGVIAQPMSQQLPSKSRAIAEELHPDRPFPVHQTPQLASSVTTHMQSNQPVIDLVNSRPVRAHHSQPAAAPATAEQLSRSTASEHQAAQSSRQSDARHESSQAAEPIIRPSSHASSSSQPVQTQQAEAQRAKEHPKLQSQSASAKIASLTQQIKQMKAKMIHYASFLDNPEWKQQQPDRGKAVSHPVKADKACTALLKLALCSPCVSGLKVINAAACFAHASVKQQQSPVKETAS